MAEPNLNVEFSAVTDEKGKFRRLAKLLGLADADHARGKCEHLWLACTRRGETDLPQWLVEEVLGERGPAALVDAELARWAGGRGDSKTRRLRISGARKHCTWLASKSEQSSKGGKARASQASRVGGKFAENPTSPNQPSDSDSDPISDPEEKNLSLAHAHTIPGDGGQHGSGHPVPHATQQGAATPGQSASLAAGNVAEPQLDPIGHRVERPPSPRSFAAADLARARERGALAEATWQRLSELRVSHAAKLRLPGVLPLPPIAPSNHPRGFRELQERIREEGEHARAACAHVLEVLDKQAGDTKSIEWLDEKAFLSGAWNKARSTPLAKRKPPAAAPPPAASIAPADLAGSAELAAAWSLLGIAKEPA